MSANQKTQTTGMRVGFVLQTLENRRSVSPITGKLHPETSNHWSVSAGLCLLVLCLVFPASVLADGGYYGVKYKSWTTDWTDGTPTVFAGDWLEAEVWLWYQNDPGLGAQLRYTTDNWSTILYDGFGRGQVSGNDVRYSNQGSSVGGWNSNTTVKMQVQSWHEWYGDDFYSPVLEFTVQSLVAPSGPSAAQPSTNRDSQIDLSWTRGVSGSLTRNTLILRSTNSNFTGPTQGTGYTVGQTINSDEYVVYLGDASGFNDTGLTNGTTYYYAFYAENYSYYSPGVTSQGATLASVGSFRGLNDQGRVVLEWTTEMEVGTAGFYVHRQDAPGGAYTRVNTELVPAQLSGPQGGTYRLADPGAVPGKKYEYRLEEVEADGDRNMYGPYEVEVTGRAGSVQKEERGSAYTRQPKAVTKERKTRNALRDAEVKTAREARAKLVGTSVKIGVKEDGVYYLDAAGLAAIMGMPAATVERMIKLRQLQVMNRGEEVIYLVEGSGLYFYGEGLESIYTDENVYWLGFGSSQRPATQSGGSPLATVEEGSFRESVHAETNRMAVPALFEDPEADMWMWEYVVAGAPGLGTRSFPLKTDGAVPGGSATLRVKLMGYTDTGVSDEHHVSVKVNGTEVGDGRWTGKEPCELRVTFAQNILRDGDNTVEVSGLLDTGAPYSVFYVDALEMEYGRYYRAVNDQLEARGETNGVMTITGFGKNEVIVLNVTNPKRIAVVGQTRIEQAGGDSWRVSLLPANATSKYLAYTPDSVKTPASMLAVIPTTLTSSQNRGQYIVIAPGELRETAQALADYRAGQGYKTMVVDLEAVYDAFNYGIVSPHAIRQFLDYAYGCWAVPPEYVVLIGEGSYDYKNYQGNGDCVVPPKMVDTPDGLFESDTWYADVAGDDGVPEIAVGRLPVMTAEELAGQIEKIMAYESASGDWTRNVLMVADNSDEAGEFPEDSDRVGMLVPGGYAKQRIYLGEWTIGDARTAILNGINGGALLLNYIGHGALNQLAQEGMLRATDVPGLANGEKLPVMLALTCVAGRYGVPGNDCLSELLLLKNGGGVVAAWAPSGLSMNNLAVVLDEGFFRSRFTDGETILGDAVLSALEDYGASGGDTFMLRIYNLLGDPALRVK